MRQERLFDRKVYLELLGKRVLGLKHGYRQNIAIIGDELAGKTSLALSFLKKFYDTSFVFIYLQVQPEDPGSFCSRFIATLLYNFLDNSAIPLKEDIEFLVNKSEKYIPLTTARIRSIRAQLKRKKTPLFSELLSLTDILHQETGKYCLVIMDEFINLEKVGFKNMYKDWSRLLVTGKSTMYIIISSLKYKARQVLSRDLSLLFGNFEVVNVEPFDQKTSQEYLDFVSAGRSTNIGLKKFLAQFSAGYPLYLDILSQALSGQGQDRITESIGSVLFDSAGILNQRFLAYIRRFLELPQGNEYLNLLFHVSCGRNKIKDIAHLLRKGREVVASRINRLLEMDALVRSGDFLKVNDRLFGFWLRFVYQGKMQSLTPEARQQKELFKAKIEGIIQEFIDHSKMPLIERMSELLRMFGDDTLQLEKKKIRLEHFQEVKPLEFGCQCLRQGLIGRSQDGIWVIAIKQDSLTEDDIVEFVRECRKYRNKLQKKIIVTLAGIDSNARLKAMEEKVITWDINSVNQIMDLFSKPMVCL